MDFVYLLEEAFDQIADEDFEEAAHKFRVLADLIEQGVDVQELSEALTVIYTTHGPSSPEEY